MDLDAILKQLRQQLTAVNESILAIEHMASGGKRGRGRPPKWMAAVNAPKRRGRPPGSRKRPAGKED